MVYWSVSSIWLQLYLVHGFNNNPDLYAVACARPLQTQALRAWSAPLAFVQLTSMMTPACMSTTTHTWWSTASAPHQQLSGCLVVDEALLC
jgi:hypothetical protein